MAEKKLPAPATVPANAQEYTKVDVIIGVGSWCVCSIGMMVTNKMAIHIFPMESSLVIMQMLTTVLAMLCTWNSLHFGSLWDVLRWLRVVPFFSGMLLTSILALKTSPMSLVITFRTLSPLLSLAVERFYPNPARVSWELLASMLTMLLGCLMYIWDTPGGNYAGIFWVIVNSLVCVGDRLLQRLMLAADQAPVDISKTGVTLLNNLFGVLPMFAVMYFTNEVSEAPEAFGTLGSNPFATFVVSASCLVGIGIAYTGVLAQSMISATSFLVMVNVNKFAVIFVEVALLKNALSALQITGCAVAILAGAWYAQAKEKADKAHSEEKEPLIGTK